MRDILATSREPLRGAGERVYRLPPLEHPPADQSLTASEALRFPAVRLFVERAAASLDGFETPRPGRCRRDGGVPQARRHRAGDRTDRRAASRPSGSTAWRPCWTIASTFPKGGAPLSRATRRSARRSTGATPCFPENERVTLRRAAVFTGAFTLEAARFVLPTTDETPANVGRDIANLVVKSLVSAFIDRPKPVYRLLDTTRGYARNKLVEAGESDARDAAARAIFRDHTASGRSRLGGPAIRRLDRVSPRDDR